MDDRDKTKEQLRESESRYRLLAENVTDLIWTMDMNLRFTYMSPSVSRMLGFTAEEFMGRSLDEVMTPESLGMVNTIVREELEKENSDDRADPDRSRVVESELLVKTGATIPAETKASFLRDGDSRPVGILGVTRDITDRKRAEEAMELRLEFEKTVSNISSRFVASGIDGAVNGSLEDMGRLSGASRAYLFLYSEDGTAVNNTHEWCAEGVVPQIENLQGLPIDMIPWWMERLRNGEVIHVKDVSKMPAEAEAEKKILQDQDIKSLLVFPLGVGGKLAGFVGFDDVIEARGWREEDLRLLQMSSDIIGNAIYRKRAEEALRATRDGLERRVKERTSDLEEAVRALRKSEAGLAEAQRIARMGNWDWNVLTDEMTWSEEVCQLFDITTGQLGSNYDEFLKSVRPEDREFVKKAASLALKEGRPYDIDHRIILPDGTERVVHQRGEVVPDSTGRPARMFGIIHDITERKRLEEDLARLAAATESSADGIVITDLNGSILYVNPAFERISGYSREECVGRDVQVCSGSEHEQQFRQEIWEALNRDGIWRGCLDRAKKDGSHYQEERTITAVKHSSGEVINYAHIIRDVTEKLRLESIAQAVNTMSNTGYIFSGIRHEIGNPINSVGAVLKMLKSSIDKYDKQAIYNYIDRALNEISSVEVLLNNLKSFNMYENPKLGDVNLPVFMDKFLSLVKTDSGKKGVAIAASVAPDVELCRADPRALQQVLMNVLTNAWDACGRRENPRISIDVSKHLGMIQIEVSDNGCGIDMAQQENLFKPFYTGKPNGTGLGLVIARKMLAMMNASIEVTSEKDVGTTASIHFPEAQSES